VALDFLTQFPEGDEVAISTSLREGGNRFCPQYAPQLGQTAVQVRHLTEDRRDEDGVEARVTEWETLGICTHEADPMAGPNAVAGEAEHLGLEIEHDSRALGRRGCEERAEEPWP
jgi:hypothetical protein